MRPTAVPGALVRGPLAPSIDAAAACHAAAAANGGVGPLYAELKVLRIVIYAVKDDEIFEAAGQIELALVEEAQIAGT